MAATDELQRPSHVALAGAGAEGDTFERAKRGDRAAQEAIYRCHVQRIGGLTARLLGNRADAEDCVQDTFAIAFERLGDLRDADALSSWLAQIAVSQVRRRFRRKKMLRMLGFDAAANDLQLEAFPWPGASPEMHAELMQLWIALQRLPIEERLAWCLRRIEGHELEPIAAACRCSVATAKRRIAAADAHVRKLTGVEVTS